MQNRIVLGFVALTAFLPLQFVVSEAHAQHSASRTSLERIDGFDVKPVEQPTPGNELEFTLYGSPGGIATVLIDGATGTTTLEESETGVYEGTYTIRKRDRITAASRATANLRMGNRVATAILDEPMVGKIYAGRADRHDRSAAAPRIDRFDAITPPRLEAGEELILTLSGSPGGTASARIAGVKGKIVLDEIRTGVYEGAYTIKNRDRISSNATVTGNLRINNRETSAVLGQSLQAGAGHPSRTRPEARLCANCGVVEAINIVEVKGDGTYLGKIAGGVAGALIGSQIGQGRGTTVAEVAGAAGGVYAGNEIEKRMKTSKHYEVVVRLENGGSTTVSYAAAPGFTVGTRVKAENGALTVIQ